MLNVQRYSKCFCYMLFITYTYYIYILLFFRERHDVLCMTTIHIIMYHIIVYFLYIKSYTRNNLMIIFLALNEVLAIAIMSSLLYSLNHLIFSHVHFPTCSDLHFLSCRFLCHLLILNKYRLLKNVSKLARWFANDVCAHILRKIGYFCECICFRGMQ